MKEKRVFTSLQFDVYFPIFPIIQKSGVLISREKSVISSSLSSFKANWIQGTFLKMVDETPDWCIEENPKKV